MRAPKPVWPNISWTAPYAGLLQALSIPTLSKSALLKAVNDQRAILQLTPLADLSAETDLKTGLTAGPVTSATPLRKAVATAEIEAFNRATKAHIAAIHHSPWNEDRGKGAIDLDGAIDVSFVVNVKGTGLAKVFTLSCTGANDGEEGLVTSFRLESIALGKDADGKVTTAPVVVQADIVASDGSNLKGNSAKAFESLKLALTEHGQVSPDGSRGFPHGMMVVSRDKWQCQFYADARAKEPAVDGKPCGFFQFKHTDELIPLWEKYGNPKIATWDLGRYSKPRAVAD